MGLLQWFIKFLIKNTSGGTVKNEIISNKELSEEFTKLLVKNLRRRKVHSPFIDDIWGAYLADTQLIRKFNKEFRLLSHAIDIYSKHA